MSHWQCKLDRAVADALAAADTDHKVALNARESDWQTASQQQHEAAIADLKSLCDISLIHSYTKLLCTPFDNCILVSVLVTCEAKAL
jgi:hypothetical protein